MPRIVLLSMKRSGTNWFMDLVNRLPGVLAIREAFNPSGVFGIDKRDAVVRRALAHRLGLPDVTERSPQAIAFARDRPLEFLEMAEAASRSAGHTWFGVTIFEGQVADGALAAILAHPGTRTIVLVRHQLPRYVSLVKATQLSAWKSVDTTDYRPEIDVRGFAAEARRARAWFARALPLARDPVILTYEDHVLGGPERCLAALRDALPVAPGARTPEPWMRRQDRNDDVFAAVADGAGLRMALNSAGLAAEAFAYPIDGLTPREDFNRSEKDQTRNGLNF
jgi:hypothetical protein